MLRARQRASGHPPIEALVRARIDARGRITFAELMELALYAPGEGYYARVGAGRDYRTSPQVSPAFGHVVGAAIARAWRVMERPSPFVILEPAAGDGRLATQISGYLVAREPELASVCSYVAIDRGSVPSTTGGVDRVRGDASAPPLRPFVGCVVSNELFDALPVHRLVRTEHGLGELWIESDLTVREGPLSDAALATLLPDDGERLRPGQIADVAPSVPDVLRALADVLERGFVVTIDYGGESDDVYGPHRMEGTLVAYRAHRPNGDLLDRLGDQDLTAHVDFGLLMRSGERFGLRTDAFTTQRDFLLGQGLGDWLARLDPDKLGVADLFNARAAAAELVAPSGLGKLRVLVQSRGVPPQPGGWPMV